MKLKIISSILISSLLSYAATGQDFVEDINIAAAVDLVTPVSFDNSSENKVNVRSAELMFFGPIDHVFDGVLNMAAHNESGAFEYSIHEGYISSSKLIPRSQIKVGKFLLGIGRLNRFHQHDWPFVTAPKVHREFFNPGTSVFTAETASDSGIEYSWLLPTEFYIDITVGVTNGYCFGHCHQDGNRPKYPIHYIRPSTFFEIGDNGGMETGLSLLQRVDSSDTETSLFGLDLTFKRREGKVIKWLVQSEAYLEVQNAVGSEKTEKAGMYIFTNYGYDENISYGLRLDGFSQTNLEFQSNGQKRGDFDYAIVPTLTYKVSEFTTLRLAYAHEVDTTEGSDDVNDRQLQVQITFLLGAHPSHDF